MILQKYKKVPVDKIKIINFILSTFFLFSSLKIFFLKKCNISWKKMLYFFYENSLCGLKFLISHKIFIRKNVRF